MFLEQFLPASPCSSKFEAAVSQGSSHSAVSSHWTNFADIHFIPKSLKLPDISQNKFLLLSYLPSVQFSVCSHQIMTHFCSIKECLETSYLSTDVRLSLKRQSHSKKGPSQNAVLKIIQVSFHICTRSVQNLIHTFCSVLLDMPNTRVTWKLKIKNRQEGKGHHRLKVDTIPRPAQTSLPEICICF